jgi:hypothetical protein
MRIEVFPHRPKISSEQNNQYILTAQDFEGILMLTEMWLQTTYFSYDFQKYTFDLLTDKGIKIN